MGKNKTSEQVMQAIDGIIDSAISPNNGTSQGGKEVKKPGADYPQSNPNQDKNSEIRIQKHIQERDDARAENQQLRQQLAKMQGEIETIKGFVNPSEPDVDPTENMTDTEAALYKGIKALENQVSQITNAVGQVQNVAVKNEYRNRESAFFQNNPEANANREATKEAIKAYLKERPLVAQEVLAGNVPLQKVYEAAKYVLGESSKVNNNATQDGSKFFGTGRPENAEPRSEYTEPDGWDNAKSVLSNPESENKKQAVDFGVSEIADDILESMAQF